MPRKWRTKKCKKDIKKVLTVVATMVYDCRLVEESAQQKMAG